MEQYFMDGTKNNALDGYKPSIDTRGKNATYIVFISNNISFNEYGMDVKLRPRSQFNPQRKFFFQR